MAKKLIQKYMPDHQLIKKHKHLKMFGKLLHDVNLWHFNRRSVSGAFAVGFFCAFLPIPMQMVVAAAIAIILRVNLPISVSLVWITNPITIPPIFYLSYKVGSFVMGLEAIDNDYAPTKDWFVQQLDCIWQPFLLGCLICGTISAALAYTSVRLFWRLHIISLIKERKARKKTKKTYKNARKLS